MGLFKKKAKGPVDVGSAMCAVDDAGHGFVAQQYHEAITSEAIAALAPITFALNAAVGFGSRSNADAQRWMDSIMAFGDAESLTSSVNWAGVTPFDGADPNATLKAVSTGRFMLTPKSELIGLWSPQGAFDPDEDAMPLLGVLMSAAISTGADNVVWYALDLATSSNVDFTNMAVLESLPQHLLDAGAHLAGFDDLKYPSSD